MENLELLNKIANEWKLEAKQENDTFFFYIDNVEALKNADKCYVIGRKGMGKTAISEYLYKQADNKTVFSERLSFKSFPFNSLYSLDDKSYTAPNQYISIWKYLIYNAICKMMARNDEIEEDIKKALTKMYELQPIKALKKLVPQWVADGFGAEILGLAANVSGLQKKESGLSWIKKSEILENIIEKHARNSYYYVLIDELDEDYRDFEKPDDRKQYLNLLTSLFKAVQDIKAYFNDTGINLRPIVFLRSDIYSLIRDSDKNKWSDYRLNLTWNPDKLYKMLCYRLAKTAGNTNLTDSIWEIIFIHKFVFMGNRGHNRMGIFPYNYSQHTLAAPRLYSLYFTMRKTCS